jgi:voltage-gated potassium channel
MGGAGTFKGSWRTRAYLWLAGHETGSAAPAAARGLVIAAVAIGVTGAILGTLPGLGEVQRQLLQSAMSAAAAVFALEYICRIWSAPERDPEALARPGQARWHYLRSFLGITDLLVILPLLSGRILGVAPDLANLALLLSLLKLARYAKPLSLFVAVFRNEGRALFSGLMAMMLLMVLVSGIMFMLERHAQPDVFRSIPDAMWWAIVTMATVGYGDITPITPLGKMFGGMTMLLGVAMFAIPAGILANGFAAEIRKRDFVVTWHTVANLPLFASLDATHIANIAHLLKTQVLPARQVVVRRGDSADAMFFIMAGEVEVDVLPNPVRLGKGQYFGEIALIKDTVRTATVTTLSECQLLSLGVSDFRRLMAQYPDLKTAIERVADERLRQVSGMAKPEAD